MDVSSEDYILNAAGHDHVLAALRQILADGRARSLDELCNAGVKPGLLPAGTIPKYVYQAVAAAIDRSILRGERAEFIELSDGRFRLNVRPDMFTGHRDAVQPNPELDTFIAHLHATSRREATPDPDESKLGGPFERDVTKAFELLGFDVKHLGGEGEPDVIVSAPLGNTAYTFTWSVRRRRTIARTRT
jgi:hypothetical protein